MEKESNEKDLPGYPHYSTREDIMNQPGNGRLDIDVENITQANNHTKAEVLQNAGSPPTSDKKETDVDELTESDITPEEIMLLDAAEGEDFEDATGDDLDIPGSEQDDKDEAIGEEDEENNYYSIGGDAHENLEEDKGD